MHNPEYEELRHRNCQECRDYETHRSRYLAPRKTHKHNVEKQNASAVNSEAAYFAADLEIVMLPRLEEFEVVMFCPRINFL